MAILVRRLSDDIVAGHIEVESREKCRQSGLIRRRSRNPVSYPGWGPGTLNGSSRPFLAALRLGRGHVTSFSITTASSPVVA